MKRFSFLIMLFFAVLLVKKSMAGNRYDVLVKDTVIPRPVDTTVKDTTRFGSVTVITSKKGDGDKDETKVIIGGSSDSTQRKNVRLSWFSFDLGLNNYIDRSDYGTAEVNDFAPGTPAATEGMFSLRTGKSVNVNIWPVMVKVNLIDHHLGFKTGIGIEMNNYRYTKNITYKNDISKTYIFRDSISFRKNKLFTEYLTIPLLLTFESNPYHYGRSFHLSAGPTFGYLVKSRTKQRSKEFGKIKNNDPFNLEKFRTALRTEIGYGPITLYGYYSFTPIHQYGLKQYPFSIGIILNR